MVTQAKSDPECDEGRGFLKLALGIGGFLLLICLGIWLGLRLHRDGNRDWKPVEDREALLQRLERLPEALLPELGPEARLRTRLEQLIDRSLEG